VRNIETPDRMDIRTMAQKIPMTAELFGKTLDRLVEMVVLGKAHIKIGRGLGQDVGGDPAVASVASTFWGMTMTAHLDVAQLIAFKLFDPRHGTMTVEYLLARAEELKGSFANATAGQVEDMVKTARMRIATISDSLKKIRAKRNRVLAHVDVTIVSNPEKLAKDVELTFSDLNVVLATAGSILNDLAVASRDISPLYDMIGADDYKSAVALIVDAKCAQIRTYEAEFGPWEYLRPKKCQ